MERPHWAPVGVDAQRPSIARVYDYYLGGYHNFAVDRQAAEAALRIAPDGRLGAHANRAFLRRAVRLCIDAGVRQFLDIGSGIPTVGNVHEVAQNADPAARVVYVDIDWVAVTHSNHILDGNDRATAVLGDIREPERILDDPAVRKMLDLSEPVALLAIAVLHFVPDECDPAGLIARLRDQLAPGSYLAVTHTTDDELSAEQNNALRRFGEMVAPVCTRSRDEVVALFDGFDLVEPGVVWMADWRPDPVVAVDAPTGRLYCYGGVGRKR